MGAWTEMHKPTALTENPPENGRQPRIQRLKEIWKSMGPLYLSDRIDPGFLLLMPVLLLPPFLNANEEKLELTPNPDWFSDLFKYLWDPAYLFLIAWVVIAYALLHFGSRWLGIPFPTREAFSVKERLFMGWYYWNGCLCHMMLDGFSGGHYFLPSMTSNYYLVDARFKKEGMPHAAHEEGNALVILIVRLELYVYMPLCMICYVGMALDRPWHHELQIITLMFQMMGTLCFYSPEFMTSCVNLAPQGVPTCLPGLTWYTFTYYYFGTGVGAVWLVVPLLMLWLLARESSALKVLPARKQDSTCLKVWPLPSTPHYPGPGAPSTKPGTHSTANVIEVESLA